MGRGIGGLAAIIIIAAMLGISGCSRSIETTELSRARVGDIYMAYKTIGEGYPTLFIMGYSGTMDMWDPRLINNLGRRYKVIVFDNRGMGRTTASPKEFSIEQFADDTAGLMGALGIKRANVVGYSMGTAIAQELALKYPDKVNNLILYAADCGGTECVSASPEVIKQLTDISGTKKEREARMIKLLFPETWLKAQRNIRKRLPRVRETSTAANIERQARAMLGWKGSYERLPLISQHTLLITGTDDIITPPDNSMIMAKRIPGSWLARLEGGGHGVMYQRPRDMARIIRAFLESEK